MNFTKEYIDLCKNNKLQELRKEIQLYDWVNSFDYEAHIIEFEDYLKVANRYRDKEYWLPRSDQLDEEIVKICREKKWTYCFRLVNMPEYKDYEVYINDNDCNKYEYFNETNPLIAKLKLLLSLLESEE